MLGCRSGSLGILQGALRFLIYTTLLIKKKDMDHMIINFHSFFFFFGLQSTGSADAARDILVDGIKHVPNCKLLLKVLLSFPSNHIIASQNQNTCRKQ